MLKFNKSIIYCTLYCFLLYICTITNKEIMTTIELNNKYRKEMNLNDFKTLLSTVGMGWYGIENWTRGDLDLFETKFEGFTVEPTDKNTMRVWDRSFDYSPLYK